MLLVTIEAMHILHNCRESIKLKCRKSHFFVFVGNTSASLLRWTNEEMQIIYTCVHFELQCDLSFQEGEFNYRHINWYLLIVLLNSVHSLIIWLLRGICYHTPCSQIASVAAFTVAGKRKTLLLYWYHAALLHDLKMNPCSTAIFHIGV